MSLAFRGSLRFPCFGKMPRARVVSAFLASGVLAIASVFANDQKPDGALTNFAVRELAPGKFVIGKVRFDKKSQTVSFPAVVNFREGPIEYLVVTTGGKIHESVFRTEADPQHIHLAMLLLGASGAGTNALPEDPLKSLPGQKVRIEVRWQAEGKDRQRAGEEFVRDRKARRAMSKGDWIYNGSRIRADGFAAQQDGSIVSLITDPDALINNPRPGREDDDNWLAIAKALPPLETPVTVTLQLQH
jgi:hypothetical protein